LTPHLFLLPTFPDLLFAFAGAASPTKEGAARWGIRGVNGQGEETVDGLVDGEEEKPPHGPVVDALRKDERLGAALEAIAAGGGDEIDAGTLSRPSFFLSFFFSPY
jgi:hypothetical protein